MIDPFLAFRLSNLPSRPSTTEACSQIEDLFMSILVKG